MRRLKVWGLFLLVAASFIYLYKDNIRHCYRIFLQSDSSFFSWGGGASGKADSLNTPLYDAIKYIARNVSESSVFYVGRQADFGYYLSNDFYSYLDPRLLKLYEATDQSLALAELNSLGITHFFIPPYALPFIENTELRAILNDPKLTEILFEHENVKVLKLRSPEEGGSVSLVESRRILGEFSHKWRVISGLFLDLKHSEVEGLDSIDIDMSYRPRGTSLDMISLYENPGLVPSHVGYEMKVGPGNYTIDYNSKGNGKFRLVLYEYDKRRFLRRRWIQESILVNDERQQVAQFKISKGVSEIRLGFTFMDRSEVSISDIRLNKYSIEDEVLLGELPDGWSLNGENWNVNPYIFGTFSEKGDGILRAYGGKTKPVKIASPWFEVAELTQDFELLLEGSGLGLINVFMENSEGNRALITGYVLSENAKNYNVTYNLNKSTPMRSPKLIARSIMGKFLEKGERIYDWAQQLGNLKFKPTESHFRLVIELSKSSLAPGKLNFQYPKLYLSNVVLKSRVCEDEICFRESFE